MRSRMSALALSFVLVLALGGCSKKDQSQTQPATTDNTQAAQTTTAPESGQPMANSAPGQQQQQQMSPAPEKQMAKSTPAPPPPPPPITVPAGTSLVVRMGNTIDTKTANNGDTFTGTLAHPVSVDGEVAIRSGAGVSGTVVDAKSPGRFKGAGALSVTLNSIVVGGQSMTIDTSTYAQTVKGKGKRTAVLTGGGAGAGALIGGLAGGGKGALIGGLVGAGAGGAGSAFTGNKDLRIPAESVVTFKLSSPISEKRTGKKKAAADEATDQ
jgi:hypothetical protein